MKGTHPRILARALQILLIDHDRRLIEHGPVFEPLADPDFFAKVRVDDELGTVVWPNGADLDPLVSHGDFEPAARLAYR